MSFLGLDNFKFDTQDSSSTGRQGSEVQFPKQFALDLNKTVGGPLTIYDLFKLAPKPTSLFGYGPTQAQQPSGSYSLGFGPPTTATLATTPSAPAPSASTPQQPGSGPTLGFGSSGSPSSPATPSAPTSTAPKGYSLSDLTGSYFTDPDKAMDLPRLFRQAGLSGTSFTYDDIANAVNNAKKYGFSGRSQKNFTQMLANLQRDSKLDDAFAGGKGTGIF